MEDVYRFVLFYKLFVEESLDRVLWSVGKTLTHNLDSGDLAVAWKQEVCILANLLQLGIYGSLVESQIVGQDCHQSHQMLVALYDQRLCDVRHSVEQCLHLLGVPLGWPWEAQSSPRVARERWGWRSSHCRA